MPERLVLGDVVRPSLSPYLLNRPSTRAQHLEGVERLCEEGRDCHLELIAGSLAAKLDDVGPCA